MGLVDDPDIDLGDIGRRLTAWLQRRPDGAWREVHSLRQASRANGFSNETYRFTLTNPGEELILRLPPARSGLFPGYDIARQWHFMQGLANEPGLRLAPCRWLEADRATFGRPFFVTGFVDGEVAADRPCYVREGWIADAAPEQQRRLWRGSVDQLGRLAGVRWQGRRLAAVDWPDPGTPRALQHIALWQQLAEWGRAQLPKEDTQAFDGLHDWLVRERPREEVAGIVWGDARFGNIVFQDFEPAALLDWELAVVGDPMLDIAYLLFHVFLMELMHGDADTPRRFAGFDGDEATVARWCESTQRGPVGYRWCWLFNAWKMLAIWECKAALLLRSGQATLDEALDVRRAARLMPHIGHVLESGADAAFVRPPPSRAPAAA